MPLKVSNGPDYFLMAGCFIGFIVGFLRSRS